MYKDFSKLFHQSAKDRSGGGTVVIPQDSSTWPISWKTTYYKVYDRFKKLALDREWVAGDISKLLQNRKSRRDFSPIGLSRGEIGKLLLASCGESGPLNAYGGERKRRTYPSGGARFSIETYVLVLIPGDGLPAGVYHYSVKQHALELLWERYFSKKDIGELFSYPWVQDASAVVLFTTVFDRFKPKYGERGYRYMLLEAGHISQNVYLVAEALTLKCCAIGGVNDELVEKQLDIDGVTESFVHAVVVGK